MAAGATWDRNNSWASADLSPVLDLAARTGAGVQIRDQAGDTVASLPGFAKETGPQSSDPSSSGARGLAWPWPGPPVPASTPTDYTLLTILLRAIAGAAGLAALLALLTGLAVARRITRPVTRLIAVT